MKWLLIEILLLTLAVELLTQNTRFNERYSWSTLNFQFPDEQSRQAAINSRDYVPINNVPLGTEIWRDRFFVTVPRWLTGIASTVNFFTMNNAGKNRIETNTKEHVLKRFGRQNCESIISIALHQKNKIIYLSMKYSETWHVFSEVC